MFPLLAAAVLVDDHYLEEQRELKRLRNARRAEIRRQHNPLNDLPDDEFHNHYRVSKDFVRWLCGRVEPYLAHHGVTSTIPTIHQVLCTLRFLAVGSYQESIGQSMDLGLSQPTVSRILSWVSTAIELLEHEFITFPTEEEQREFISSEFEIMAHFPGIIGCIDGTHIPIMPPSNEKWAFLNHKRFYSLNVQVTCDHRKVITSLDIFAGAAHDSRIWRGSPVKAEMARLHATGVGPYFLLGDSGYPLTPYILSPFEEVGLGTPEADFNVRHKHTRCLIERVFGELKGKWRCLKKERTMYYQPDIAARFFKCCVILHNALIIRRDPMYAAHIPNDDGDDDINNNDNVNINIYDYNVELDDELDEGNELREMIVRTYCTDNENT